jgi:lipoate-protein ligase A
MLLLDLTLESAAENLALDEALLLEAEEAAGPQEVLRVWESDQTFVVIGSSSKVVGEVNVPSCRSDGVPVLYAVLLSYDRHPHLRAVDLAHRHVLGRLAASIGRHIDGVREAGTSDLAIFDRKFSGNSLRCKRSHFVYHGTLLYGFAVEQIGRYLRFPERQPEYRQGRTHGEFVTNLPLDRATLIHAVREAFEAGESLREWPRERTTELVAKKYSRDAWNLRR